MILFLSVKQSTINPYKLVPLLAIAVMTVGAIPSRAQTPNPTTTCILSGADTVSAGSTAGYRLSPCTADNWTVSCGFFVGQGASSVTLNFSGTSCSVVTLTATKGGAAVATKTIILRQATTLDAATIGNPSQEINSNQAPPLLAAPPATGGNCGGSYTYQWLSSTDSIHFSPITGATAQNYQPGQLSQTTFFKRQAQCGASAVVNSTAVKVMVDPVPAILRLNPAVQSINYHTAPAAITFSPTGYNNVSYLWQSSSSNSFAGAVFVGGSSSTSYSPDTLNATMFCRVAMIRSGDTSYSATAVVTVLPALNGGSLTPASQTVGSDGLSSFITITGITGGDGNYTYQWYSSPDGSTWNVVDGVTTSGYNPGSVQTDTWYRVLVTSRGVSVTGAAALVKID